jgi:hypothetical protein
MAIATLRRRLDRLEQWLAPPRPTAPAGRGLLAALRADPAAVLRLAGITPDPWQATTLATTCKNALMLCSRQTGKSTTAAALALRDVLLVPRSLVILLSPTLRQSAELFRKLTDLYAALGRPMRATRETALTLELANGSRVVSLPENETGVRGYSGARLLVIDEAARVSDDLYRAVRPMLAVSRGRVVACSTPFGKRGWFYEAWESGEPWHRVRVTADRCPRIAREFLEAERRAIGDRWYAQEYECEFVEAVGQVFPSACIDAMFH